MDGRHHGERQQCRSESVVGTGVFLKGSRDIGHEGSVHMDRGKLDDTNIVTGVTYNVTMFVVIP